MINIQRNGTKVVLHFESSIGSFPFAFDCGAEWAAKALYIVLRDELYARIKNVREEEYTAGLKDARKKKAERRLWFPPNLMIRK